MNVDSKWIEMRQIPFKGKTLQWAVISKAGGIELGRIKWYTPWWQYAFFPIRGTLYEEDCLRDIAGFLEAHTTFHKSKGK